MPRGRRRQNVRIDILALVMKARQAGRSALGQLRKEISAARNRLEKLVAEERTFRLDLFGTGGPGRPGTASRSPRTSRPAARKAKPRRKGPPKADKFLAKLPTKFTIDDVRKVAGKATAISLAQWARAKKLKRTAEGYQKVG
jgi:hypothetical protein